jgi:branched-chain amino acid transport system ATP-binding protein
MTPGKALLDIKAVSVTYGRTQALHHVSVAVSQSEIVAILGANGAGKSTLAKSICGLAPVASGRIVLEERDITHVSASRRPKLGITCVPEGRGVFSDLTVLENLRLGHRVGLHRDSTAADTSIDSVLDEFPKLRARLSQAAGTLSGGEQQMLVLGRAILARPRLLILDEPSLGLAPIIVSEVYERIQSYPSRGITVLLIEQAARKSLGVASRAYVLSNGRVATEGPSAELMESDLVQETYLGSNAEHA